MLNIFVQKQSYACSLIFMWPVLTRFIMMICNARSQSCERYSLQITLKNSDIIDDEGGHTPMFLGHIGLYSFLIVFLIWYQSCIKYCKYTINFSAKRPLEFRWLNCCLQKNKTALSCMFQRYLCSGVNSDGQTGLLSWWKLWFIQVCWTGELSIAGICKRQLQTHMWLFSPSTIGSIK